MFAGNDVIAISSIGSASGNFWLRILKKRPRFYIHVQLTLVVNLERFRRYSTFYLTGISLLGATFWGFGAKWPQNVKWERNICCDGTSLCQTASFKPLCSNLSLSLSVWSVQVRKTKKAGRKSHEVYISRTRGAIPSGRIPTKLGKCVRLTNIIKLAKFHRNNVRVVMCWSFHVAIGNPGHPYHAAWRYRTAVDQKLTWVQSFVCNTHQTTQIWNCLHHRRKTTEAVNFQLHNIQ